MKIRFKRFILFFITLALLIPLTSCKISMLEKDNNSIKVNEADDYSVPQPVIKGDYIVSFVCNNGYTYQSYTNKDNKVLKPDNPTKKNATFLGWATSTEYDTLFNFNSVLTSNVILYAKYSLDYISIFNEASSKNVLSNVRIVVSNGNYFHTTSESLGSGVIIHEDSDYYYCLTNHHVIYTNTSNQSITITDAFTKEQSASLVTKDVNYDLALLRFEKRSKLYVANLADYEIYKNEVVVAIGEPEGQSNTITYGYLLGKRMNVPDNDTLELSNIRFDIYYHDAPINSGSSGGALFDSNLNLVGINFASCYDDNGVYVSSETIPSFKALEFLYNANLF